MFNLVARDVYISDEVQEFLNNRPTDRPTKTKSKTKATKKAL